MKKVLVMETGGTFATESSDGVRSLAKKSGIYEYKEVLEKKEKYGFEFEIERPIFTLSENMTFDKQRKIIKAIESKDLSKYAGVIVTHGTDTMAFTSNLLSLYFNDIDTPIVVVGANHPITMEKSNGRVNFLGAIDLIFTEGVRGTFVVYKKNAIDLKDVEIHLGSRMKQMDQIRDGYDSYRGHIYGRVENNKVEVFDGVDFSKKSNYKFDIDKIEEPNILKLYSYVGLNYEKIDLDSYDAVVVETYHSGTVNTDDSEPEFSINTLFKRAEELNIPAFITEVSSSEETYESSENLVKVDNLKIVYDNSVENTYVKLQLGLKTFNKEELYKFLDDSVFFEKVK